MIRTGRTGPRILVLALFIAAFACTAAAAEYELRLVPFDDTGSTVAERITRDSASWAQFQSALTEQQRIGFVSPYACWARGMLLDEQPVFEIYERGMYIDRLPVARPPLKPGKHTIWPGGHVFTAKEDGTVSSEDPDILLSTEDLKAGGVRHLIKIKCYPVTIRSENADPSARKPRNLLEEIPLPELTLRDASNNEAALATDSGNKKSEVKELLPDIRRYLWLTAWVPANAVGKGYVVHPMRETFHLGAEGISPGAGEGQALPGWRIEAYNIIIPLRRISAWGGQGMEIIFPGVQKLSFFPEYAGQTDIPRHANLYPRQSPHEFRVSEAGPSVLIDGDLSVLPNKVLRVDWSDTKKLYQRGIVVETSSLHLASAGALRARVRAVDPTVSAEAAREAADATAGAKAATEQLNKARSALQAAQQQFDGVKAGKDVSPDQVSKAQSAVDEANNVLAKAEAEQKEAERRAVAAEEAAKAAAERNLNPLADAKPFARLQARGNYDWLDLELKTEASTGMTELSLPELPPGLYKLRVGVRPAQPGKSDLYADQWVTIAKGNTNGVGVFTQRGRTAFYRGERFWLGLTAIAQAQDGTVTPVPAAAPVAVDLIDATNVRLPLYRSETKQEIRDRETFIIDIGSATSLALAPGRYRVDARVGGRLGAPCILEIVDAAPETRFTKLLNGKYNEFGGLYSAVLGNRGTSADEVARAIAESGYNAFMGMTYAMDRVQWGDRDLEQLVRGRPELGPWEAYAPSSGRDKFMDAALRHNLRFYENIFTQHDSMMPRGGKMLDACERYATFEVQSMRHSPAFRGICLYDELSQSLDHDTAMSMMAYFHRADELNYRRKYNGRTSSDALRARDRFTSLPEGQRRYEDIKLYRTWPMHLDAQWRELSELIGGAAKSIMPDSVNFTQARINALPGGTLQCEDVLRPLQAAITVGYKDMGGFGAFPVAGPLAADVLNAHDAKHALQVWPMIVGAGTGPYDTSNLRDAFFTLSQRCDGMSFMQFESTPNAQLEDNFHGLRSIAALLTPYGDLFLEMQKGYKQVAIYYSREMDCVSGSALQCEGLWTACIRAGYPADFLTDTMIRGDEGMGYKVVFVPGFSSRDAIPPETIEALKRLKAAGKIIAVERGSRLELDGIERLDSDFTEIADCCGGSFPKHLDHDDERWWDMTVETTKAVQAFLSKHVPPAAIHNLLVGPDWLRCRQAEYLVIPNLAFTGFTGNHKTLYQAPDRPTIRFPKRPPVCYDMLEMKRVEVAQQGEEMSLAVDFRYYPGKIYAFLPASIEKVVIRAASAVRAGEPFSYEIFAANERDEKIDAGIPVEITTEASGRRLQKVYRACAPEYRGAWAVPVNIGSGSFVLRVRELISGKFAEATISVAEGRLPAGVLDTRTVRMSDAEKIREFLADDCAAAAPLFTANDILDPVRLAMRVRDDKGALSQYLKSCFAPATLKLIQDLKGQDTPPKELAGALAAELNKILTGEALYADERFPPGSLTAESRRLGQTATPRHKLADLNRLLLEEYYSAEITRRPPVFIGVDEEWAQPQAERLCKELQKQGRRVRVANMAAWMSGPGPGWSASQKEEEMIIDGTRLWRGEVVEPGVFVDAPVILLGDREGLVQRLIDRDLLPEPVSENFPGRGRAIIAWVRKAFSNYHNTIAVLATDENGLARGIDSLVSIEGETMKYAQPVRPVIEEAKFRDIADAKTFAGKEQRPSSFRDALSLEDRVETLDIDPATGRILVGTFGFGHNLFCFSAKGELLWKSFLPEHDVYFARWYDNGSRVVASTGQGFFIFLINGENGSVLKRFASTEWPDFHVNEREYRTKVHIAFNPTLRQILILGRTGVLAVNYDGGRMWFYDRAFDIVDYPPKAVQTAWAGFGCYLKLASAVPSPDGFMLAYNEFRYFASFIGDGQVILPLWRNEPQILDARTGKVLLKDISDPGSNDLWNVTWPAGSPNPWIHAANLSAPLLFTGKPGPGGGPDPGALGKFVPPADPPLKIGGRLSKSYNSAMRVDDTGRIIWQMHDRQFWVQGLDQINGGDTRLYRCSRDGLVRCIDLATGKVVWEHTLPFVARLLVTGDDRVIAGARNGAIAQFDPAGNIAWQTLLREHHDVPERDYAAYVAEATRRDRDDTREFYPVCDDGPDDYKDILRTGNQQVDNGGFETADDWTASSGEANLDNVAHEGNKSLLLHDGQQVTSRIQRKVIPSATYLLEFFYRPKQQGTKLAAGAALAGAKTVFTLSNFSGRPGEWSFGRIAIKTMADTTAIHVGFEAGGGEANVDAVSLKPIRFPSANLLADANLHKVEPTHPEDFRIRYSRVPPPLKQKLMSRNNVTAFMQATPLGSLIFTQEQAFLHNGRLDDIGPMWFYKPDPVGFTAVLMKPAYVSHLVLYLNNSMPDTVYRSIAILANDMQTKIPRTVALVRASRRRFIVVHFPETLYTDNLKILPGVTRTQRDCMTEIEIYGPVGGPETLRNKKFNPDPLATPMFMGAPSHVPGTLPDDLVGEYVEQQRHGTEWPPAFHAGATVVDAQLTFADALGAFQAVSITKEKEEELRLKQQEARKKGEEFSTAWRVGTVTPLTTPARYAGRLIAGSADYRMHAVADNGAHIWAFETGGRVYSSPTPDKDEVYFGSDDGRLYKTDVDSGILIWEFTTGGRIRSAPAIDGERAYFASWDGYLYAVDKERGTEAWKAPIAPYTLSSPAVYQGRVYIADEEGALHCVNASNGSLAWQARIEQDPGLNHISMCPVIVPEGVFVAADNGAAALIDMDGGVRWKRDILQAARAQADTPPRVTGQPFATKTQVVVPSTQGLFVVKRQDGTPDDRFVPPVRGRNLVSAVPYGRILCVVENGIRLRGDWQHIIIGQGASVVVWSPKEQKQ